MNRDQDGQWKGVFAVWSAFGLTALISAPGLCASITGWLDEWGIIDLRSGMDGTLHFFSALLAPIVTLFALAPLSVLVMGVRGRSATKITAAFIVIAAIVLTYLVPMRRIF